MAFAAAALVLLGTQPESRHAELAEALAAGDAHYGRRAEGANGGPAQPFHIEGALAEYRRALAIDGRSQDARVGVLRSVFFRTGFCGPMARDEQVRLLDEAKRVAEDALAALPHTKQLRAGEAPPFAARLYLWAAIAWGQWAAFHRVSAAWSGAPGRIRDLAEAVIALDPDTEQAGAFILLGRLHSEAPKIPFVTGWVSRQKGLRWFRDGVARAPDNPALVYFAGEALMRSAQTASEGRQLLERCASLAPRSEFAAEDTHYARKARERLIGLR